MESWQRRGQNVDHCANYRRRNKNQVLTAKITSTKKQTFLSDFCSRSTKSSVITFYERRFNRLSHTEKMSNGILRREAPERHHGIHLSGTFDLRNRLVAGAAQSISYLRTL